MNLQEKIEFLIRLALNDGLSKEEAYFFALNLTGVRS